MREIEDHWFLRLSAARRRWIGKGVPAEDCVCNWQKATMSWRKASLTGRNGRGTRVSAIFPAGRSLKGLTFYIPLK
jgi:hypothetical protein